MRPRRAGAAITLKAAGLARTQTVMLETSMQLHNAGACAAVHGNQLLPEHAGSDFHLWTDGDLALNVVGLNTNAAGFGEPIQVRLA